MVKNNKKIFITIIVFIFCTIPILAYARASDIINKYSVTVIPSSNSQLIINSNVDTANIYCDTLSINLELQVFENNQWQRVTSWNSSTSNKTSFSLDKSYTGIAGKKYRIKATFYAKSGNTNETRSDTSYEITAK